MRLVIATAVLLMAWVLPVQASTVAEALANPARSESDRARDARSHPEVILKLLNIGEGDMVADIFAGDGYYSQIMGQLVSPGGNVLMQNNQAYLNFVAKGLDKRFGSNEALPGVTRHDREVGDMELGEGTLDAALIIMSYHDLFYSEDSWPAIDTANFIGQIVTALKPGGRFLIVDHAAAADTGSSAAQTLHRIDEAFARQNLESYGFKYVDSADVLRNPEDDHSLTAFDPKIQGKTDRFVLLFEKP